MGNCCAVESSDSEDWAGEDWGSLTSKYNSKSKSKSISSRKVFDNEDENEKGHERDSDDNDGLMKLGSAEKERLLGSLRVSSSDANGKVKIMISKKELDKLLKGSSSSNRPDQRQQRGAGPSDPNHHHHHHHLKAGGSAAEIVLARLIYAKDHYDHRDVHHRHWKPALHSIPE